MYKAFIEPDLKAAHLRIYNTFNPFSGFMSPTYILKSARRVSKAAVEAVMQVGPGPGPGGGATLYAGLRSSGAPWGPGRGCRGWVRAVLRHGFMNFVGSFGVSFAGGHRHPSSGGPGHHFAGCSPPHRHPWA